MAKKNGRPAWFKMFLNQKAIIDAASNETAGKALKAAFQYFDTGEVVELDPAAFLVFSGIKPYIDESYADYQRSVEAGRTGGNKHWGNEE